MTAVEGMGTMVRIATIGGGPVVRTFVAALGEVSGIELAGAYSRDSERAAALAAEFDATRSWSSMDDLLADDTVDAVYVASPNSVHYRQALAAVGPGSTFCWRSPPSPPQPSSQSCWRRRHSVA